MSEMSYHYYRDPFPNLPPITPEELQGRHFLFDEPENQEERIVAFLANSAFRSAIVRSWSESTKYPEDSKFGPTVKYEHKRGMPAGQCGVTAMALGMAMVRFGIAPPEKIFYEEGSLLNARNEIIDSHHAWLRVEGDADKEEWRIDLTSYQYAKALVHPDQIIETVVQGVHHWVGHYAGINWRYEDPYIRPEARRIIPVPNAISLKYEVDEIDGKKRSTPISEYDASLFEGRLERLVYKYTKHLGRAALAEDTIWYPPNYDGSKETWNPNEDINIVYRERNIRATLEARSPVALSMWTHDCAMHALRLCKDLQVGQDLRLALDLLEKSIWTNDVTRDKLLETANAMWALSSSARLKHDPATQHLTKSVEFALLTATSAFPLRNAESAAAFALWTTFYTDQSDLKMSVVEELEWQKQHLNLVMEITEQ
jgi:hypothetical protein